MAPQMRAEIMFSNLEDMHLAANALTKLGFEVKVIGWRNGTICIVALISVEYDDQNRFFDWVEGLVEPMHGEVLEAGHRPMKPPFCAICLRTKDIQHYRWVGYKDGEKLITLCTVCHKKTEEFTRSQAQMEDFARLAYEAKRAVEALEDAFTGLGDWPEHLGEMMPRLADAANDVAHEALEWANGSNADLDPSDPTTFSPTDLIADDQ
jgi:hypothetical protein